MYKLNGYKVTMYAEFTMKKNELSLETTPDRIFWSDDYEFNVSAEDEDEAIKLAEYMIHDKMDKMAMYNLSDLKWYVIELKDISRDEFKAHCHVCGKLEDTSSMEYLYEINGERRIGEDNWVCFGCKLLERSMI